MTQWGNNVKKIALCITSIFVGLIFVVAPSQAQYGSSDLVVSALFTDPAQPTPDARIELIATVANTGRNDVLQGFNVRFKLDGLLLTDKRLNFGLKAGDEEQLTFTWRASEGEHLFEVEVDILKNVQETNEFNNTETQMIVVRRPGAIRSITEDLVTSIGESLYESGELLQVEFNPDLFTLANNFQKAFLAASNTFANGRTKIQNLVTPLPSALQNEQQIKTAMRIAEIFESISSDFKLASDGILAINVEQVPLAFQGIRSSMSIMTDLKIEQISYNRLRDTLPLLETGLELGEELALAFTGAQVNTTQISSDLTDILNELGDVWIRVHNETTALAAELAPNHRDETGESIEALRIGDEVVISVEEAAALELEIFDATGSMVYEADAQSSQLTWHGKDSNGNNLSPGSYYSRLAVTDEDGTVRTELVIFIYA